MLALVIAVVGGSLVVVGSGSGLSLLPQVNRETSQVLLDRGPLHWAAVNDGLLGIAVSSRLATWLWYVLPLVVLVSGRLWVGVLVFATYGALRLGLAGAGAALTVRRNRSIQDELGSFHRLAIKLGDGGFVVIAAASIGALLL